MAKHWFELAPGAEINAARLNEIFRRIQEALDKLTTWRATGDLDMAGHRIVNLGSPRLSGDAVPLAYLKTQAIRQPSGAAESQALDAIQILVLAVPGTLSIRSSAAPLIALPRERRVAGMLALLKQPAIGGDVGLEIAVDGAKWAELTIPENARKATAGPAKAIPAEAVVALDIVRVGLTFPGSDLTLMLRLA